ncbi:hypothetical protein ABZ401_19425 [Streptomyces sp. NPDC005892]|uniref:hypothetical protein n=1 Tax=Streptomyces sp. NPDC005892 TaxID=3155593 RepID=UPI0033EB85A5
MPEPSTTRLQLYKPKNDGSELVNVQTDLNQNYDRIDLAVGYQACTSTTRPSAPYNGKGIRETDTARTYFHNGSAPASAGWVQIPNAASTFTADLDLTSGRQLNIGASASTASIAIVNAATTTDAIAFRVTGDTQNRWLADTDGTLNWGPGGASATDTSLSRSGAGVLSTPGSLVVAGDLTLSGRAQGRGLMSQVPIGQTVLTTTTETVLGTAPSFTWRNGRAYRVKVWGYASSSTPTYLFLRLRKGATIAGATYVDQMRIATITGGTSINTPAVVDVILFNSSGADIVTALSLTGQANSGITTTQWSSNGTTVSSYMTVEDIGLAADWPGVAIS